MDSAVSLSLSWIQIGNLFHYLLMTFLTGGFISALLMKERKGIKVFWRNCLDFGIRMVVLGLVSPFLLAALFIMGILTCLPFSLLLPEVFVEDQYFYYLILQSFFIFIFLLGGWLVIDIAKIRIIDDKNRGVGHSLIEAVRLFALTPTKLYGHYLLVFLIWIIFITMYWLFQNQLSDRSGGGILFEFLILQLVICGQIWIRFSRYDVLIQLMPKAKLNLR
jgi:hypothetical protein